MIASLLLCIAPVVIDADTLRCRSGERIRIAAISARERNGTCNPNNPCPTMRHEQAQPIVQRLIAGRTLHCRQVGTSWNRIVATCALPGGRDLGCAIIRTGAALDWPSYRARYRLPGCGR